MSSERPALMLTGTYTLDPLKDVLSFWNEFLGLVLDVRLAPYGQFFQQVLDPASEFRRNRSGANAAFLQWNDLVRGLSNESHISASRLLESRVAEVASALTSFEHQVPCLVTVGPAGLHQPDHVEATRRLQDLLAGTPNLFIEAGEGVMTRYGIDQAHDAASDRFGHVPFNRDAMAALGTSLVRWHAANVRAPVKVVAVDGDNTLWSGVVAEDGIEGVHIGEAQIALQRALVSQVERGRLLCLLSKNEEADVRGLFASRPDMPLRWSKFVAHRIDWNPKPRNLVGVAAELELALDSVVFLDDSPVECAEMRARCPTVTTIRVPSDAQRLATFADHLWPLDQPIVTAEDRNRAGMYRENASRAELRRQSSSLIDFLDALELVVEILQPSIAEVPRLSQLTLRTNQFSTSLVRSDEAGIGRSIASANVFHRLVRARDRFGDYGIVGQVRARSDGCRLEVDLFMLSCRALGRGIEHRMLAAAGEHAVSLQLDEVAVLYRRGERNAPARRFLEAAFETSAHSDEQWFEMPAKRAATARFFAVDSGQASGSDVQDTPTTTGVAADSLNAGARYEFIAHELTTGSDVVRAMSKMIRARPDLAQGFVSPAAGLQRDIASIWQEVLRVNLVGINDRFNDLGGKSIHLVQVHRLLLDRLGVEVDITALFQHATVALLASHLAGRVTASVRAATAARDRGAKMREARAQAARRRGVAQ